MTTETDGEVDGQFLFANEWLQGGFSEPPTAEEVAITNDNMRVMRAAARAGSLGSTTLQNTPELVDSGRSSETAAPTSDAQMPRTRGMGNGLLAPADFLDPVQRDAIISEYRQRRMH